MTSEHSFKVISDYVYDLDSNSESYNPQLKVDEVKEFGGREYQILKTEDNPDNGMQAMAVAPVKGNKADTSEIIIAYAGTNFGDPLDIHTDVQTVVMGVKDFIVDEFRPFRTIPTSAPIPIPASTEESQIITAKRFAEEVKTDYPDAEVTTTGHSLEEYLALYVSAEINGEMLALMVQTPVTCFFFNYSSIIHHAPISNC